MGDERVVVPAQAERVLQLRPAAEDRPGESPTQPDRLGHVAPGPAYDQLPAAERADHRVVGPHVDRPIVETEGIGDARQPRQRVLIVVGDRLIRDIAAGQHHRTAQRAEQQVVQQACTAASPRAGGCPAPPPARPRRPRPLRRPPAAAAARSAACRWPAATPRSESISHSRAAAWTSATISANGLSSRCLRSRRAAAAGLAARVDREVIAAEPLNRQHLARGQQRRRRGDRIAVTLAAGRVEQAQPGAAGGAAHRLSVEPAVGRVGVLGRALGAQAEARHRGQRPVVGDVPHDREPRPAVRAVDERVAEPAVGRIGQLGQAVGAGRAVGRDQRLAAAARRSLDAMENPAPPLGGRAVVRTASIRASGGASRSSDARKSSTRGRAVPRSR